MERTNTQEKKLSLFGVAVGIAEGMLSLGIVAAVIFYILVQEAGAGNVTAIVILTVCGSGVLFVVGGMLSWATILVNQKQDERAMVMLAKMMQMNAMENQMIVEQQKRMAIQAPAENQYLTIDGDALKGLEDA